ncbi:MAG TPA: His/Gly/Thr/Pro-type tRNA ligase C-terminal domain-containing protein [Candidatus Paceibacterota bacterium]|nr:His/Gly/Thr/Pro-type tRNA ligase C-terminal domain-containing protein [Candidatus Paceibacterota bacterium]
MAMRQSLLFTKTRKEAPKDEVSKNAELLIRAGFIHKEMAGVYSFLPLGLRVMNKITTIIREEMNAIGGEELFLTALQDKNVWDTTGRWSDAVVDNWFKTKLKNDTELGLGFTHEEPLTHLMKDYIRSYRDLPVYTYQIQTKFRNEARAKSGIMRGREFLMKDLYSFSKDIPSHEAFYEKAKEAYIRVFNRVGLGDKTYVTFASGGSFSKYSHEFQTITDAGEDTIYVDEKKKIAVNKEVLTDDVLKDLGVEKSDLVPKKAVEVGNIFSLGTRFSDAFELTYVDETGSPKPVVMGSYGIGPGRLMGTVVEVLSDASGIVWPQSIAPYAVHLISLGKAGSETEKEAVRMYENLKKAGIEVLFDDRDMRPGEKFADSDLIGIPLRVVVSDKTLKEQGVEVKERSTGKIECMSFDTFTSYFKK